ncbi:MAG TPA: dockerin type I repeat-containing protein [Kofleriaceae bacterium]|nr:dockerin type I repeat-containing protein [Kofleriaceae bacterium]
MSPREWHPDELELELSRTGEADERVQAHVDGCARCQIERDALAAMATELAVPPPAVLIPRDRDAAIRAAIPQVRPQRRARTLLYVLAPVAAAAIALAVLWPRGERTAAEPPPRVAEAPAQPGDVNRDGQVDVRDAYALARALERGGAQRSWDVTGDGQVDRGDVDWIAMAAVSIGDLSHLGGRP